MKYIKKEMVETTVVDEEIKDTKAVLEILESVCSGKIDAAICFNKSGGIPQSHNRVRINAIDKEKMMIDLTVFGKDSYSMRVKNVPIGSLTYLEVSSGSSEKFAKQDNVSRTDMLDLS